MKETIVKNIPVRDKVWKNPSYCSSRLALMQHLAVLAHNKWRGTMQNTLSSPEKQIQKESMAKNLKHASYFP
ncbi:hypothetical protein MTR_5g042247 [Medicago truncatula]|uniref:Uncharacterized protein n=1 Tax=Medicago truncatula TaxID=3880 RepID=A0A072UPS0_MEDTR|nr:hypothetical protein MTR_5g042247 [Medicago truncatula]